jgi:hypothetical protein
LLCKAFSFTLFLPTPHETTHTGSKYKQEKHKYIEENCKFLKVGMKNERGEISGGDIPSISTLISY